ncbi:MAG: hypothetical protein EBR87_11270, partial [Cytophagia bacterium]|nr:hypothetical protein [Cytophagia bacterium]
MNPNSFINIAIDGYSSCGKSTMAKALAKDIGFTYIDSGAMYRCVTLYFITQNVDLDNLDAVNKALNEIELDVHENQYNLRLSVYLNRNYILACYYPNAVSYTHLTLPTK